MRDFAGVSLLATSAFILVVNPGVPAATMKELLALARAKPGTLNYGSAGAGSSLHMTGEFFKHTTGLDILHVAYKGTAPALIDLIGGQVQMVFSTMPPALPHVKSGKLRALGVTGNKRSALFPEVPTIAEAGLPGFEVLSWYGLIGPAGMPQDVVRRLNAEAAKGATSKDFRARMEPLGFDIVTSTPEKMVEMLRADSARWAALIKAAGVTIN
jgi:tripartite-type tricarboxylate transporter receptor subunit TctC